MAKIEIPFVGQSYQMPAVQLDAQTCINWYLTFDPTGKYARALLPDPGLLTWAEVSNGRSVRGMFELNGILYAVIDNTFYSIDNNGNEKTLGFLNTASGNVRFTANNSQLFLTDTQFGYVYQLVDSATRSAGDFFVIAEASSLISAPVFEGSGIDDLSTSGGYTGSTNKDYRVEIQTPGTPDTFRWSDNGGTTWNLENIQITGNAQALNDGVFVTFQYTTGHTQRDRWDFSTTANSAFYVPIVPAYQDTFGIYARQSSRDWYVSEPGDFSRVNALGFAQANIWPDNLVAAISLREEVWLICRTTTEIWYDIGTIPFPFERRSNLIIKYGTLSPYSVAVAENNILFWLGNNEEGGKVIVMVVNYEPMIISTEPINAELQTYTDIENAIGFTYQWDGHVFYAITFPADDRTWVYDLSTKSWHERRSTLNNALPNQSPTRQGRWRANNYVYFQGKHLVGDFESGRIYQFDRDTYTENGTYMLFERTTQELSQSLHYMCLYSLEVDMQKGVGLTVDTQQGHDPQVMLQISKNDGVSWGNEMWKSIGKTGKYRQRIKWNRLGQADSFVFRVRVTDPVYAVLLGAVAEIEDTET